MDLFNKRGAEPAELAEVAAKLSLIATLQAKLKIIEITKLLFNIKPLSRLRLKARENHNNRGQAKSLSQRRRDMQAKVA